MKFSEYSAERLDRSLHQAEGPYPDIGHNAVYPALGLVGEAGEAAEKVKKIWRARRLMDGSLYTDEDRAKLVKELGDVLWYLDALAYEIGETLESVARANLEKVRDRGLRGVVKGEGDNR